MINNNNLKIQLQTLIGHQLSLRAILVLLFIIMLDPVNCTQINSFKLTKIKQDAQLPSSDLPRYILETQINGKQYDLLAQLSDGPSWIKNDECIVCDSNVDKQQCKQGQECGIGVQCTRSSCKKVDKIGAKLPACALEGNSVQLKLKVPSLKENKDTKLIHKTILVSRMKQYNDHDGVVSLSNGDLMLGDSTLLVKNNDKDITVFFYPDGNPQPDWKGVDILHPDSAQHGDKTVSKSLNVQTQNIMGIRLRQLFKQVQKNIKSQSGQPKISDPTQSIFPMTNSSYKFSLVSSSLLIPNQIYKKLCSALTQKYYAECKIKPDSNDETKTIISCPDKQMLNLQRLDNVTITLQMQESQIQFPFRALIETCLEKQCVLDVGVSDSKKTIVIGDFIFNLFAVQFMSASQKVKSIQLFRLNNQWAQNFEKDRKYSPHQLNFMWMFITFIFMAIMWVLKIIFYLALIALIMNCLFHWRQVLGYILDILAKLTNKQLRDQLKEQKLEALQKFSSNIKNKLNKKLKLKKSKRSANKFQSVPQSSNANLEQQVSLQSQHRQAKVMSLEELSDPSSNSQDEHDIVEGAKNEIVGRLRTKKEEIQNALEEAKKVLVQKMQSRKQIPNILRQMPVQIKKAVGQGIDKFAQFKRIVNDGERQKEKKQEKEGKEVISVQMGDKEIKQQLTPKQSSIEATTEQKQQQFYEFDTNENELSFADY